VGRRMEETFWSEGVKEIEGSRRAKRRGSRML
jgi:hypothetical protein